MLTLDGINFYETEEVEEILRDRDKQWKNHLDYVYENFLNRETFVLTPITKAYFNDDTTVVFFADGDKIVLKKSKKDTYSPETAIAYAYMKKTFGSHSQYKKFVEEIVNIDKERKKEISSREKAKKVSKPSNKKAVLAKKANKVNGK